MTSTFELARRLLELESQVASRAPQLAYSAIEAGAVTVLDETDGLKGSVGMQFDGASFAAEYNGPAPLTPTQPYADGAPAVNGAVQIRWDGLWADGDVVPSNFTRCEIHIQKDTEPVGDIADTIFGTFETPRGGEQSFNLPAGTYYVALVARNLSGARGPRSAATQFTVSAVVSDVDLAAVQTAVDEAQQAADDAQAAVDGVPAQIATAKQEAIDAAALTADNLADLAQANAIAAAGTDATTKANAAQAAAIAAAATDATTKANSAQAAAIAAASSDASTKATQAKVDAIAAAATDATTKANTAKTDAIAAAALTAQQKADLAQAAAISAAATDATTKSNAAQVAAIAAAATDATTKSNTALASALAADSKVNNPSRSGTTTGWSLATGPAGSVLAIEDKDFNGTTVKAMKLTTSGDAQFASDYFDIDTTKAYEIRFYVLDPTGAPSGLALQFYAGTNTVTTTLSSTSVLPIVPDTGASAGAEQSNPYFYITRDEAATWREHVHYVFPVGATADDMKKLGRPTSAGTGGSLLNFQFKPNATKMRVRLLNWNNAGVTRDLWVAHVTVREMGLADLRAASVIESWRTSGTATMDGGQITAASIIAGKLAVDSVAANNIVANAVVAGKIAAGAVIAGTIAADAVTATTIAAGAVIAGKLAADSVLATNIKAGEVTAGKLAALSVIAGNIAADAVTANTIAAGSVTAAKIGALAVTAGKIDALAVTATELAAGSVIAGKIATDAVTTNTIAANAITAGKILAGEIIAGKLATGAVIAGNIAADAVTATTIAAGAVVAGKLAANSVVATNIAALSIQTSHLAIGDMSNLVPNGAGELGLANVGWLGAAGLTLDTVDRPDEVRGVWKCATTTGTTTPILTDWVNVEPGEQLWFEFWAKADIAGSKMYIEVRNQDSAGLPSGTWVAVPGENNSALSSGYPVGNLTLPTVWTKYVVQGTIPATGTRRIRMGLVYFNHSTGVTGAVQSIAIRMRRRNAGKLIVDGSITAAKVAADAITTTALAADAVTAVKLAADAVVARNIKAGEVTAGKLAALSVVAGTIAANAVTASTVAAGAIEAGKLAAGAVIAGNLAANAVTAGTIAAGAITTDKLDADAINGLVITGSTLRTAATGARMAMRPGTSSIGFGSGVLEIFSGNSSEGAPAELYTIADGSGVNDNISLYISAPEKTGYTGSRAFIQMFAKDGDNSSQIIAASQVSSVRGSQSGRVEGPGANGAVNYIRVNDAAQDFFTDSARRFYIDNAGTYSYGDHNVTANLIAGGGIVASGMDFVGFSSAGSFTSVGAYAGAPAGLASGTFVAPRSGRVAVIVGGFTKGGASTNRAAAAYELRTGSTVGSGTLIQGYLGANAIGNYGVDWVVGSRFSYVGGLTAGATYNIRIYFSTDAAGGQVSSTSINILPLI